MTNPPNSTIFQYVRNRRGQKVGVVVAVKVERSDKAPLVGLGWSLCNPLDKFDPVRALDMAIGRANKFGGMDPVPRGVREDFEVIASRATKYFKNCEIWC